jgi:hypothetical protein
VPPSNSMRRYSEQLSLTRSAMVELDAFFIVRGCVSGVEARTLAVA